MFKFIKALFGIKPKGKKADAIGIVDLKIQVLSNLIRKAEAGLIKANEKGVCDLIESEATRLLKDGYLDLNTDEFSLTYLNKEAIARFVRAELIGLAITWEHYSGDEVYPIKANAGSKLTPKQQYENGYRWVGLQFAYRAALMTHMICCVYKAQEYLRHKNEQV